MFKIRRNIECSTGRTTGNKSSIILSAFMCIILCLYVHNCEFFSLFQEDIIIYLFMKTGMFFTLFEVENSIFNLFFSLFCV